MEYKIEIGKRYEFPLSIPPDGKYKNGLVEKVEGNYATLRTKNNEEWEIGICYLRPVKKI